MANGYWFKSGQFKIQEGEEEETNPGCYGKSLAEWISGEFSGLGYHTQVIAEDWGWCVMCTRGEYLLWIGCGSMFTDDIAAGSPENPPDANEITWYVFTMIEVPFFMVKSLLKKWTGRLDLKTPLEKLKAELDSVLASNKNLAFCDEP